MRDAIRSIEPDKVSMRVLRATLASLGFGKKSSEHGDFEQWTAPAGISVTIHAHGAPAARTSHTIGNLQVFDLPPGATVEGRYLRLSPAELAIVLVLARAKSDYVTLIDLSKAVKIGAPMSLRALTVHVFELRRKLAQSHSNAEVTTKRSLGYKLSAAN
ncbi:MAG TPA: winged helix-turn-helix domain-containing protein [Candidatus Eremiobacteraceae bacterium]|nr:winged helix-turn-helix domain-containing protein [Candidatus Eremiobacteraceae bacterium]